jgi:hypothetical protein
MFGSFIPPVVCGRVHACFVYVICVCLHIVVSNTYCVVFLFMFFLRLPYHMLPDITTRNSEHVKNYLEHESKCQYKGHKYIWYQQNHLDSMHLSKYSK